MPHRYVVLNGNGRDQAIRGRANGIPFLTPLPINLRSLQKHSHRYRITQARDGKKVLSEQAGAWAFEEPLNP